MSYDWISTLTTIDKLDYKHKKNIEKNDVINCLNKDLKNKLRRLHRSSQGLDIETGSLKESLSLLQKQITKKIKRFKTKKSIDLKNKVIIFKKKKVDKSEIEKISLEKSFVTVSTSQRLNKTNTPTIRILKSPKSSNTSLNKIEDSALKVLNIKIALF